MTQMRVQKVVMMGRRKRRCCLPVMSKRIFHRRLKKHCTRQRHKRERNGRHLSTASMHARSEGHVPRKHVHGPMHEIRRVGEAAKRARHGMTQQGMHETRSSGR